MKLDDAIAAQKPLVQRLLDGVAAIGADPFASWRIDRGDLCRINDRKMRSSDVPGPDLAILIPHGFPRTRYRLREHCQCRVARAVELQRAHLGNEIAQGASSSALQDVDYSFGVVPLQVACALIFAEQASSKRGNGIEIIHGPWVSEENVDASVALKSAWCQVNQGSESI